MVLIGSQKEKPSKIHSFFVDMKVRKYCSYLACIHFLLFAFYHSILTFPEKAEFDLNFYLFIFSIFFLLEEKDGFI